MTDRVGTERYYSHGRLHREDGPAVIDSGKGLREWWQNGKLHRTDGPAIECDFDATEYWYDAGKLHRVDGPAAREPNGDLSWYNHGELILTMFAENPSP